MAATRERASRWPLGAAVIRLRELFQYPIPGLAERAARYQTDADDPDDETWTLFQTEMQSTLELLETARTARDATTVRERGHSLEGMGGMVGLPDLSVVGAELNQAARRQDWGRCKLLTQQLRVWIAYLCGAKEDDAQAAARSSGESAPGPAVSRQPSQTVVLIADDDPPVLAMLRKLLSARDYGVLEASDGTMALELAQQHLPSLALLDVAMPGLSGYQVCERLKAEPRTREIAVIMVTARDGAESVEQGIRAGAFDYVRKPFEPRELLARVRNALDLKRTTDALQRYRQLMSREIEVAGSLQRKLFPTQPRCGPGYEVHLTYRPSLSIGGDLFDAFPLPDGRLCAYMGDVAGHGVAPAIVSALLKAVITEAAHGLAAAGPAAVCREIQQRFRYHVANPDLYATLFLAFLDAQRGQWTCMNCGHPDPTLIQADGTSISPQLTGRGDVPIGFWFGAPDGYAVDAEVSGSAPPGSTLWLITDGLFEARHRKTGEPCGQERLLALVQRIQADAYSVSPAAELLNALQQDGFELGADDCSAMAVECVDPRAVRLDRHLPLDLGAMSTTAADIAQILQAEGWSDVAAGLARMVAMEHGANIIKHGRPPPSSAIHVRLRLSGSLCRLWFTDQGHEWDYPNRPRAASEVPLTSEHGRGLALIQAASRHTEYFRRDHENVAFFAVDREPAALQAQASIPAAP